MIHLCKTTNLYNFKPPRYIIKSSYHQDIQKCVTFNLYKILKPTNYTFLMCKSMKIYKCIKPHGIQMSKSKKLHKWLLTWTYINKRNHKAVKNSLPWKYLLRQIRLETIVKLFYLFTDWLFRYVSQQSKSKNLKVNTYICWF